MKTIDIGMIGVSAALYAIVGILTNMGIVSPVVGVVKFWPAVIVPGIFSVLFGSWVGGMGAAIGIFVSDMIQPGHGIALLSLTVGCTSNFAGFYLIGLISKRKIDWRKTLLALIIGSVGLTAMTVYVFAVGLIDIFILILFLTVLFSSIGIVIGFGL